MSDSTSSPPTSPVSRVPLWVKLTLFGSLALNLVVVGLVAGMMSRGGPDGRSGGPGREGATPFTQALDKDARRAISRDLKRSMRESAEGREIRRMRREDHAAALAVLRAPDFDAEAFVATLERQAGLTTQLATKGAEALSRHLQEISFEERLSYADRVEDVLKSAHKARKPGLRKE
ncbi:MAG: periplasmic heavy metal sensor [Marinovum sp.]|nr:periplasmic heavy metal sensor [Marinovum sp.]